MRVAVAGGDYGMEAALEGGEVGGEQGGLGLCVWWGSCMGSGSRARTVIVVSGAFGTSRASIGASSARASIRSGSMIVHFDFDFRSTGSALMGRIRRSPRSLGILSSSFDIPSCFSAQVVLLHHGARFAHIVLGHGNWSWVMVAATSRVAAYYSSATDFVVGTDAAMAAMGSVSTVEGWDREVVGAWLEVVSLVPARPVFGVVDISA